ncbi:YDG domain-containing protein [Pseudomonas lopnurensis]|uniref:YDG domain-containing protein n=1 Tax=Pseudomonas lopnurensis TaxID=1477517 RepID=UPI0028A724DB|nr:YDG domain-containing protein [Pseudomonas lopnurensis]
MIKPSLNHAYRLVWSDSQGGFVPVAENARSHRKSNAASTVLLCSALLSAPALAADLPTGGVVVGGAGSIGQNGNAMTIQQDSSKLAIDWNSFDIGKGHSVTFNQPGRDAVALNRVLGSDVSVIQGAINANGQVFLVNPNGVLFTPDAQVNVGGLVASTLAISTSDFMAGNYRFAGDSSNAIVNQGNITTAPGGSIALIAAKISNTGSLTATGGNVLLGAGSKVTLDLGGPVKLEVEQAAIDALIEQGGAIRADGGSVYLTAKAAGELASTVINHTGITEARTLATGEKGEIVLLGDMHNDRILVAGTLDASAPHGGDGGFIETSAASVRIEDGIKVTTKAASGRIGKWLIDPSDFTIGAGSASHTESGIGAETLSSNLESTSVELYTFPVGSEAGDIHVDAAVQWEADTTLTLSAYGDININAAITATGENAGLVLNYGGYRQNDSAASGSDYHVKAPVTLSGENASLNINGESYTLIHSIEALDAIDSPLRGYYALARNLDAGGATYNTNLVSSVQGTVAGLGHVISNLHITGLNTVGVFGTAQASAVIRDLGIANASITASGDAGGLVARNYGLIHNAWYNGTVSGGSSTGGLVAINYAGGIIRDSHSAGSVTNTGSNTGGLVGSNYGTISDSHSTATVSGRNYVGGLIGRGNADATYGISSSWAAGNVSGSSYVGGLVGGNPGSISDSYATGNVSATDQHIGGLAGTSTGSIVRVYATGNVTSEAGSALGGLVGTNSGSITDAYATGNVSTTGQLAGGLISSHSYGSISNVYATGNVTGGPTAPYIGGLIGRVHSGSISQAYATGQVSGTSNTVGGLVGNLTAPASLSDAYWDSISTGRGVAVGLAQGSSSNVTDITDSNRYSHTAYANLGTWEQVGGSDAWVAKDSAGNAQWIMIEGQTRPFLFSEYSTDISNAHQLQLMAYDLTADYRLVRDIDASATASGGGSSIWSTAGFDPIGEIDFFTGSLDGQGHTISGLTIVRPDEEYVGLIGLFSGSIANVGLVDASVSGYESVGALAGGNGGSIIGSYVSGSVSGNLAVGGLVGSNPGGSITNSYATADVLGDQSVGGLAGWVSSGSIVNTYATGNVTGDYTAGGLIGLYSSGSVSNNFWNTETSGRDNGVGVGNIPGITGLDSSQFTQLANFSAWGDAIDSQGGTGSIWRIYEGHSAPLLRSFLKQVTVSLADKTYDGQTSGGSDYLLSDPTASLDGSLSYSTSSKNAGTYSTDDDSLTVNQGLYSHQQGYDIIDQADSLTINKKVVGVSATAENKAYDGTVAATVNGVLNAGDLIADDDIAFSGNATGTFTDKNAGIGKIVNVSLSGITLSGADAGNYMLAGSDGAPLTTTATINQATISAVSGITAENKTYDGSNAAILDSSGATFAGIIDGDTLAVGSASGTFTDKNAGTGKTVNITGITLTGSDAGNYQLADNTATTTATILTKGLEVAGSTAQSRDYDGTTAATVNAGDLSGVIVDDSVAVSGSGTFDDKNAGSGKKVYVTYQLSGDDSGNYHVVGETLGADIHQKGLQVSGSNAATKFYDGGVDAQISVGTLSGIIDGDSVDVTGSGEFADKNAGFGKQVTVTYTLAGEDSGNYFVVDDTQPLSADIRAKVLQIVGSSAASKTYDGGTDAQVSVGTLAGVVDGDSVSAAGSGAFADKNAGAGKQVTVTYTLSGEDSGNYLLLSQFLSADILAKVLQISGTTVDGKTYDGSTAATVNAGGLTGIIVDDSVTVSGGGTFANKNAGAGKQVTVTYTLAGDDSGNYRLDTETLSADIWVKTLDLSGSSATSKTYDGGSDAQVSVGDIDGIVAGDSVNVSGSGEFADKNVGSGKKVYATYQLSGTDSDNYYVVGGETLSADILAKVLQIVGSSAASKTYDGGTDAQVSVGTLAGVVDGDSVSVVGSGEFDDKNAAIGKQVTATYQLSGTDSGNYVVVGGETLSADILAKVLQISGTTVDGKTYDGSTAATVNAGALTGLVAGETLGLGATGVFDSANAGARTVTVQYTLSDGGGLAKKADDGGLASNYILADTVHQATIDPRAITVAADSLSKTYGDSDPTLGWSVTAGNLVGDDTLNGTLTRASGENVGSYAIDASGLANGNYLVTAHNGTLTIDPRAITVTADSLSKTYGDSDPTLGWSVTAGNLVGDDTLNGTLTRASGENVGSYAIDASGLANGNYLVTAHNGTLTIDPRAITVTADSLSKTYGGNDPALTWQVTQGNLVGNDVLSGALVRESGEGAGRYAIDASGLANGNYLITAVDGVLIIQDGRQTESAIAAAQALPAVPLVRARAVEPGVGPGGLEFVTLESEALPVNGALPQAGGSTAGFARVLVVEGGIHLPSQPDLQEGI